MITRPLPHHFAGAWGAEQVADLEEDLVILEQDLATAAAAITAIQTSTGTTAASVAETLRGATAGGGADGEDGVGWPGRDGAPGVPGRAGQDGAGADGEDGIGWPGPMGLTGLPGALGIGWPGEDGEDGTGWPGPRGNTGATGATATVIDSTATGAQNDWAPGISGDTLITWHGASDLAVTGLASGAAGQIVTLKNTGTKVATFAYNSGSSAAGNKLYNVATSAPTPVAPGGFLTYQHDGTQWQLVGHEQGAWITPTFAAGDYVGQGTMTWTVDSANVGGSAYRLDGATLSVNIVVESTTIGGTPTSEVRRTIPGGFSAKGRYNVTSVQIVNVGVFQAGIAYTSAAGTFIGVQKVTAAVWVVETNNCAVYAAVAFEVT